MSTFRSSKIVYYGPHPCSNCGVTIAKMGHEWGGNAFTYPSGPIYPNTEWHVHVCDPKDVWRYEAGKKKEAVLQSFGDGTRAAKVEGRWRVFGAQGVELFPNNSVHCQTELDAFCYVHQRMTTA